MVLFRQPWIRNHLGFVADWCPLCGGIEYLSAAWLRRRTPPPLFGGSILDGAMRVLGDELAARTGNEPIEVSCVRCGQTWRAEPDRFTMFDPEPTDPPIMLVHRTLAGGRREADRQIALHARAHAPDATSDERIQHIVRAIRAVDHGVDRRYGAGNVTLAQSVLVILLLLTTPIPFVMHHVQGWTLATVASIAAPSVVFGGLAWHALDRGRVRTRRRIPPVLARAIASISPTRDELQAALDQTHGRTVSKLVDVGSILRGIDAHLRQPPRPGE